MLTKLINDDLKKVTGGIIEIDHVPFKGRFYVVEDGRKNALVYYRDLRDAVNTDWEIFGRIHRGGNYPGFDMPIPDRETLFTAYQLKFRNIGEGNVENREQFGDYVLL